MKMTALAFHLRDSNNRIITSLSLSIFFHTLTFIILSLVQLPGFELTDFQLSKRPIEIREITRQDLEQIRQVGIEESSTEHNILMEDIEVGDTESEREDTEEQESQEARPESQQLSFESLGIDPEHDVIVESPSAPIDDGQNAEDQPRQVGDLRVQKDPKLETPFINRELAVDQLGLQSQILNQMGTGPGAEMARRGNMFMKFEPPEGVDPDELNPLEKKFYGFQKRVFENYIRAIILSYNEMAPSGPRLRESLRTQRFNLSARVTFDKEGNVISIKMNRWTNQSEVQEFFENSLRKINKVPNIPVELIGESDQFNIYYVLQIN